MRTGKFRASVPRSELIALLIEVKRKPAQYKNETCFGDCVTVNIPIDEYCVFFRVYNISRQTSATQRPSTMTTWPTRVTSQRRHRTMATEAPAETFCFNQFSLLITKRDKWNVLLIVSRWSLQTGSAVWALYVTLQFSVFNWLSYRNLNILGLKF